MGKKSKSKLAFPSNYIAGKGYVFPSKDAEIAFLKGELEYEEKKRYQAEQALREIVKILKKAEKPIKGEIIITG